MNANVIHGTFPHVLTCTMNEWMKTNYFHFAIKVLHWTFCNEPSYEPPSDQFYLKYVWFLIRNHCYQILLNTSLDWSDSSKQDSGWPLSTKQKSEIHHHLCFYFNKLASTPCRWRRAGRRWPPDSVLVNKSLCDAKSRHLVTSRQILVTAPVHNSSHVMTRSKLNPTSPEKVHVYNLEC